MLPPPLLAEDGSFALGTLIGALAAAVAVVLGAWGLLRSRLAAARASSTAVLTDAQIKEREATAQIDRQARKDERDELRKMLQAAKEDYDGARQEIHDLRGEMGDAKTRLAVCEFERAQMREELDELRTAVEAHGIQVLRRHRPGPVVPHGPNGPDGETTVE